MGNAKYHLEEEVLCLFKARKDDMQFLNESCFQSLFHIFENGIDTGAACAEVSSVRVLMGGYDGDLPVTNTYFSGF